MRYALGFGADEFQAQDYFGWSSRLHGPWFLNRRSNTKKTRQDLRREKWEGRGIKSARAGAFAIAQVYLDLVHSHTMNWT